MALTPQARSVVLWAFAKLRHSPSQAVVTALLPTAAALAASPDEVREPQHLARSLWAAATVRRLSSRHHRALLWAACFATGPLLNRYPPQSLILLRRAMLLARFSPPPAWAHAWHAAAHQVLMDDATTPRERTQLLLGLVNSRVPQPSPQQQTLQRQKRQMLSAKLAQAYAGGTGVSTTDLSGPLQTFLRRLQQEIGQQEPAAAAAALVAGGLALMCSSPWSRRSAPAVQLLLQLAASQAERIARVESSCAAKQRLQSLLPRLRHIHHYHRSRQAGGAMWLASASDPEPS